MNLSLLFDLVLGFGVSFFTAQQNDEVVATLRKLQSAKASGANVEAHMQRVADALINGDPLDWQALNDEIDAEVDAFLNR